LIERPANLIESASVCIALLLGELVVDRQRAFGKCKAAVAKAMDELTLALIRSVMNRTDSLHLQLAQEDDQAMTGVIRLILPFQVSHL
jgi:hypothetical protein